MTLRMLSVHAHPDDESSKGAATNAYYRSRGVEVLVVSCTGGEGGDLLNPNLDADTVAMANRDIAGLRRREMKAAAEIQGISHRWLGYRDSGMARDDGSLTPGSFAALPLDTVTEPLVRIVRRFRPQVMVTYDENGGYPHPDHIKCHEVSLAAFDAAADADRYPGAGAPWRVSKLYYDRVFNAPRVRAVVDELARTAPGSALWAQLTEMLPWVEERPDRATSHVPVGDFFEVRDAALRAHASQVTPDSTFFFWPNDLQRRAWPFEDFELVRSFTETTDTESDLFAGIENH